MDTMSFLHVFCGFLPICSNPIKGKHLNKPGKMQRNPEFVSDVASGISKDLEHVFCTSQGSKAPGHMKKRMKGVVSGVFFFLVIRSS